MLSWASSTPDSVSCRGKRRIEVFGIKSLEMPDRVLKAGLEKMGATRLCTEKKDRLALASRSFCSLGDFIAIYMHKSSSLWTWTGHRLRCGLEDHTYQVKS